ncbi:MAG: phosphate ABC transporter permease PstA [Acidimicrobiia bacterium]|nr:phosphate ABC transporter permease PstA [Acidimicrobiia bacterium]
MTSTVRTPEVSVDDAVRAAITRRGVRDVKGAVFQVLLLLCLLLALLILFALIFDVLRTALPVFADRGTDVLTSGNSSVPSRAGVWQGIVGSIAITVTVILVAFPLGVAAALFIEEYAADSRLMRFVSVNVRNLAGVPSVVYGILGFAIFVGALETFTGGRTMIAAGLTLAVLVMPIVVITTSESLRAVPRAIREGGFGLGATRWEVIRTLVLPYAAPGVLTGTILSISRAIGEAAPLILVGAAMGFFRSSATDGFWDTLDGTFTALPVLIYTWVRQPQAEFRELTAAAIVVLLGVLLITNTGAILLRNHYEKRRA